MVGVAMVASLFAAGPATAQGDIAANLESEWDSSLSDIFVDFHENPELSFQEERTAKIMARLLRDAGAEVTENVGGTGVVGVMRNGPGPTVLLRADMDGLPLAEKSGLDYASTASQVDTDGVEKPVMHACGHDTHITGLVATARQLSALKDSWSGTVLFVVQPAEERIGGAKAMMEDGLYRRFPKPDYAIAWHVGAGFPAGKIMLSPGLAYSSSDSLDITVHGVGAHGASPHAGKDPVLIGAEIVVALQTLVSREISPLQPGVVTVGSFHAGSKHNIISDRAELQLTVRSNDNKVRETLLNGIKRIAENVGRMNGLPEDKLPEVRVGFESTPITVNDDELSTRLAAKFKTEFGPENVFTVDAKDGMGAEDFAYFVEPNTDVPGAYFAVGGTLQEDIDAAANGGPPVPSHHSPLFKVEAKEAVLTGAKAMTVAVLELLGKSFEIRTSE